MDKELFQIRGEWQDILEYKDGSKATLPWKQNLITISGRKLLATLMKDPSGVGGIQYIAFGVLSTTPVEADTQLGLEYYRKAVTPVFVDDINVTQVTPQKNLQMTVILDYTEGNPTTPYTEITEFGLFGGNATSTPNSGYLVNHKVHAGVAKNSNVKLTRVVVIHF